MPRRAGCPRRTRSPHARGPRLVHLTRGLRWPARAYSSPMAQPTRWRPRDPRSNPPVPTRLGHRGSLRRLTLENDPHPAPPNHSRTRHPRVPAGECRNAVPGPVARRNESAFWLDRRARSSHQPARPAQAVDDPRQWPRDLGRSRKAQAAAERAEPSIHGSRVHRQGNVSRHAGDFPGP